MASLANQTISSSYDGLVKTSTDQPVGVSGVQLLEDGVGNSLALSVGRANQGVTVTGPLTGTLSATSVLADGVIATTQATSDNSTKVATTAYVKSVVTAEDLDIAGDSGTGAIDLDSQTLTIEGTANEIETSASGQTITIGLPSTITANVTGDLTGDLTGTILTAAQTNITSVGTLSTLAVSGNLTVDTNTLFVDAANNRVGVLTTSPNTALDVNGVINVRTNGYEFGRITTNNTTATDGGLTFQTIGGGVFAEAMRINSARDVGIGTSSPDGRLHVLNGSAGAVTANGNGDELIVENSATGGLSILTPDSSTGYIIFGSPSDNEGAIIRYQQSTGLFTMGTEIAGGALTFRTGAGIEAMRLNSSGSVLIGETSISGFSSPNALRVKGGVHSDRGQFSAAGSTTTNILTLANESKNQTYLLSVRQAGGGANYALAFVNAFGAFASVTRIIQDNTNPVLDLDFDTTGLTLRLLTGAGYGVTTWDFVLTRLG